jgi:hypothetical protein
MVQLKYFGDNRDYFKYDLITSIFEARLLERYVYIPMLTDHRNDNEGIIALKDNGDKSLRLYAFIKTCPDKSLNHWETWLTPCVTSYLTAKPVDLTYFRDVSRTEYWDRFKPMMGTDKTLVFVDPDTGLQTGTPSYRKRMGSEKYILNDELNILYNWLDPKSILMAYQHLPHDESKRICSTHKKLLQVQSVCKNNFTVAYREGDLAFVFVAKSKEMFTDLQYFLKNYYDKSIHRHRNIIKLHSEPNLRTCEPATPNSNVRQLREKIIPVEHNADGMITNAEVLTVGEVIGQRVLCPGCHEKVFKKWPSGWDAHAGYKCTGVKGVSKEDRKTYFKKRFAHLFQS